jgi:hypothetical protein
MAQCTDPGPTLLSDRDLSSLIRISMQCLKHWRSIGYGPSFFKIKGGSVRYELHQVILWMDSCVVEPGVPEEQQNIVDGVFEIRVYGAR